MPQNPKTNSCILQVVAEVTIRCAWRFWRNIESKRNRLAVARNQPSVGGKPWLPEIVCSGEHNSTKLYVKIRRPGILKGRVTDINLGIIDSRLTFVCGFGAARGDAILVQSVMVSAMDRS